MRLLDTWRRRILPALFGLAALAGTRDSAAAVIRLCCDQAAWYPLTYVEAGTARGIHIDLIRRAVENLGHRLQVLPMPWVRCLLVAEAGGVDGVATASYSAQRARFLRYPADASNEALSRWAVAEVEDRIVTPAGQPFEFDGDLSRLPQPVRVPRGWTVGEFLAAAGVSVDANAPSDEANLAKLLRDGSGSAIAVQDTLAILLQRPAFAGRLHVSARPLRSQSYFLPFARRSALSEVMIQAIWDEIRRLREDPVVMAELRAAYRGPPES